MDKIEELRGLLALMESAKSSHEHELHARRAAALLPALLSRLESAEKVVEADREVDAVEDELRRTHLAGPRPGSYGTGWELRDAAAQEDRKRRYEAAHDRRAQALAAHDKDSR